MQLISRRFRQALHAGLLVTALTVEQPVVAQMAGQTTAPAVGDPTVSEPQPLQTSAPIDGHLAASAVGEVGQRQTADTTVIGLKPGARIQNRIQNRVQTRVQNRIDKNYSPLLRTGDVFTAAAQQTQVGSGK